MSAINIRPARRDDAAHLAVLVDHAAEGMASHMWRELAGTAESPVEIGRQRALREEGGFSYRNARIVEANGEIAGCMVGYPIVDDGGDRSDVPPRALGLIELEQEVPGYWYVNVLAIYPEFRGQGLGTALLEEADRIGRETNAAGMAIIVSSGNNGARRLYERHGYVYRDQRKATPYPGGRNGDEWILLTKPIT